MKMPSNVETEMARVIEHLLAEKELAADIDVSNDNRELANSLLLSPDTVARMLGISKRSVLRSNLRRITFGPKTIRYELEDVYAFIKEKKSVN